MSDPVYKKSKLGWSRGIYRKRRFLAKSIGACQKKHPQQALADCLEVTEKHAGHMKRQN